MRGRAEEKEEGLARSEMHYGIFSCPKSPQVTCDSYWIKGAEQVHIWEAWSVLGYLDLQQYLRGEVRTFDLRLRPQRCRSVQVSSYSCIHQRCWNIKPSGLSRVFPRLHGRPGTRTDLSKHFELMRTRRQAAGKVASLMVLLLFCGASSEL